MKSANGNESLLKDVESELGNHGADEPILATILEKTLTHFSCTVGTIHQLDTSTGLLALVAHRGIPNVIMDRVRQIPVGKGMAGLAAERRECVQVCNLQSDKSGQVKPMAKLTGMEGSIAVPMLVDGEVCGVLGVAKPTEYEFTPAEKQLLLDIASLIGRRLE